MPKSGSSVQHILSLGIFDYACDIVRPKEFISSTVTETQVSYKEYPVKGYGLTCVEVSLINYILIKFWGTE